MTFIKNITLVILSILLSIGCLFSQDNLLTPYKEDLSSHHLQNILSLKKTYGDEVIDYYLVNTASYKKNNINVNIEGISYQIEGKYYGKIATRHSWIGRGNHNTVRLSAIYSRLNSNTSISIQGKGTYVLVPIGDGVHALFKELILLELEDCITEEEQDEREYYDEEIPSDDSRKGSSDPHCALRLGIAATDEITMASIDNVFNNVCARILQTNEVYGENHQKPMRTELAFFRIMPGYVEGDMKKDLKRFRQVNDDFMNEIHHSRHYYNADYCGLMRSEGGGRASWWKDAGYSRAFFTVGGNALADQGNLTFTHELGHLHACRHKQGTIEDPTSTQDGWRTIMRYAGNCSNCDRIPFHSSDNQTFTDPDIGENIPLGNNNHRCIERIEDRWHNKVNFEETLVNTGIIDYNTTFGDVNNVIYADLLAMDYFVVRGQSNLISNGFSRTIRAGKAIIIEPDNDPATANTVFEVEHGAVVDIFIKEDVVNNTEECIPVNPHNRAYVEESVAQKEDESLMVYPNPATKQLNVNIEFIENEELVNISIYDTRGSRILNNLVPELNLTKMLDISHLNNGVYILVIDTNKRRLSHDFSVLK